MSSKTKIVVLHTREVIYTGIFLFLGVILLVLLYLMFNSDPNGSTETLANTSPEAEASYVPGIYASPLQLGDQTLEIQVTVDSNHINSIEFVDLSETTQAMYPLMKPALEDLAAQICEKQSTEDLSYSADSRYTSQLLLQGINQSLAKASGDIIQ